jgi:uncharacterized membrane protein
MGISILEGRPSSVRLRARPVTVALIGLTIALQVIAIQSDALRATPSSRWDFLPIPFALLGLLLAYTADMGRVRHALAIMAGWWTLLAAAVLLVWLFAHDVSFGMTSDDVRDVADVIGYLSVDASIALSTPVLVRALYGWTPSGRAIQVGVCLIAAGGAGRLVSRLIPLDTADAQGLLPIALIGLAAAASVALAWWFQDDPRDHAASDDAEVRALGETAHLSRVRADRPLRALVRLGSAWRVMGLVAMAQLLMLMLRVTSMRAGTPVMVSLLTQLLGAVALLWWAIRDVSIDDWPRVRRIALWLLMAIVVVYALHWSVAGDAGSMTRIILPLGVLAAAALTVLSWACLVTVGGKYTGTLAGAALLLTELLERSNSLVRADASWNLIPWSTIISVIVLALLLLWWVRFTAVRTVPLRSQLLLPARYGPIRRRITSVICYVPFAQLFLLSRPNAMREPDVRYHAWQAVLYWLLALLAILIVFAIRVLTGSNVTEYVTPVFIVLIWGSALGALMQSRWRTPVVSRVVMRWLTRLDREPAPGTVPFSFVHRWAYGLGVFCTVIGVMLLVLLAVIPTPRNSANSGGVLFLPLSALALVIGQRLRVRSASYLLARSHDAPVLYLRSFAVDAQDEGESLTSSYQEMVATRDETILAELFAPVGPVIGCGRPGERMPSLGAARVYFRHDEWREGIRGLVDRARVVVLRVGETEGFLWELQNVVQRVAPTNIVLYFSHRWMEDELQEAYATFLAQTGGIFPVPLPAQNDRGRFVVFDAQWTPQLIAIPSTRWNVARALGAPIGTWIEQETVHRRLARALRPWFADRGLVPASHAVFGRVSIAITSWTTGMVAPGVMLAWNWIRAGRYVVACAVIALAIGAHVALRQVAPTTVTGIEREMIRNAITLLLAITVFIVTPWISPKLARQQTSLGGRLIGPWAVAACIAIAVIAEEMVNLR